MNLENYYYFFKKALPERLCDEIVDYGKSVLKKEGQKGQVGNRKILSKDLNKIRNSNIAWLTDTWIFREIHPYVDEANKKAGWNYQWEGSEKAQFTVYKKNQHYSWHCDAFSKPYENHSKQLDGKTRKLSVTVNLTNPKDYQGGELEFDFRNTKDGKNCKRKCTEIKERGSIVVFPSFVWHRVKPVTKGTRYSLVMWNIGDPFK